MKLIYPPTIGKFTNHTNKSQTLSQSGDKTNNFLLLDANYFAKCQRTGNPEGKLYLGRL